MRAVLRVFDAEFGQNPLYPVEIICVSHFASPIGACFRRGNALCRAHWRGQELTAVNNPVPSTFPAPLQKLTAVNRVNHLPNHEAFHHAATGSRMLSIAITIGPGENEPAFAFCASVRR